MLTGLIHKYRVSKLSRYKAELKFLRQMVEYIGLDDVSSYTLNRIDTLNTRITTLELKLFRDKLEE